MLQAAGYVFVSQTDTELIAHLVHHHYESDLLEAVQATTKSLKSAYSIAVMCRDEPHRLITARDGSSLVLGLGHSENFLASDALALAGTTVTLDTPFQVPTINSGLACAKEHPSAKQLVIKNLFFINIEEFSGLNHW